MKNNQLINFESQEIRRVYHKGEWWYVIVDVVKVLSQSKNPSGYLKDMRRRDSELSKGWVQIATPLSIETKGGNQKINCSNTEGILRIIQSISSPKAEPFKQLLSEIGKVRLEVEVSPTLIMERLKQKY